MHVGAGLRGRLRRHALPAHRLLPAQRHALAQDAAVAARQGPRRHALTAAAAAHRLSSRPLCSDGATETERLCSRRCLRATETERLCSDVIIVSRRAARGMPNASGAETTGTGRRGSQKQLPFRVERYHLMPRLVTLQGRSFSYRFHSNIVT